MKSVVLCEKPSVARDIARNLGAKNNKNGCLEGDKYVVTWALGHLITLQTPDKYKEFNNVSLENLPMIPKFMKTEIIKKTFKQYKVVENALNRKDVNEVIIATDAGREGELVARYIIDKAKCNKNVKRLWISSVTDKAIKDGFRNLKDGKEYLGLYHSGIARANADWLVGINASRALTLKYNASLNCGRVQTPTLQMVFEREEKIKQFKPKDYYTFEAQIDGVKFSCGNSEFNLEKVEQFIKKNIKANVCNSFSFISVKIPDFFFSRFGKNFFNISNAVLIFHPIKNLIIFSSSQTPIFSGNQAIIDSLSSILEISFNNNLLLSLFSKNVKYNSFLLGLKS